ncbi:MAG: PAS domain S-box protein [Thermodesulfobacteriota bacterium]
MQRRAPRSFPLRMTAALLAALAVLAGGSAWLYRDQQRHFRQEAVNMLAAVAELKAGEIALWRHERLADAALLSENHLLRETVVRLLAAPDDPAPLATLRDLSQSVANHYDYADVLLVTPNGKILFSLRGKTDREAVDFPMLAEAMRFRRSTTDDLHSHADGNPHLSVMAPILAADGNDPIAVVILLSDPSQFLFPLIQNWPTPATSAETLLVMRSGDEVLFLNELRHRSGTAMKLRIPLSRADLPAAMAVQGRIGIVEGLDYRGVPVLADIRPVPDSPWFMVAKIDRREAFSAWRERAALLLTLFLTLTGSVAALAIGGWQRLQKAHFRSLYDAEARLRASMERQSVTLKAIGDAVIATDAEGRVKLVNPVAESLTGWPAGEAIGRPLADIFTIVNEKTRQPVESPVVKVLREGGIVGMANHTLLLCRDGREIPIADSGAPIHDTEGTISGVVLVFREVSEERWAQRLMQLRLDLLEFAPGHSLDEVLARALDEISELVASPIGFYHFLEEDQQTLSLQQWSTRTLKEFCTAEGKGAHYDIARAGVWVDCVHQKKPVVHNDYPSLPHRKGLPPGHAPVTREMVVPVLRRDKVVAILGLGNKATPYTEKDVEVVAYLADVTWQIVAERRSEEALKKSEQTYRTLVEALPDTVVRFDREGRFLFASDRIERILGLPAGACIGKTHRELGLPEEECAFWEDLLARAVAYGRPLAAEHTFRTRQGEETICELRFVPDPDQNGIVRSILAVGRDVTEHRRLEQEYQTLFREMMDGFALHRIICDPEGRPVDYRFLSVNPAFERLTGLKAENVVGRTVLEVLPHVEPFWIETYGGVAQSGEPTFFESYSADIGKHFEVTAFRPAPEQFACIFSDISERKHAEIEREKLQMQLLQAQKMESVGRLAGGVAHDYNNMLSVIIGYTELALDTVPPDEPLYGDLTEILKAAKRSADITRKLLAFARKQTISPKVLSLNETVEGMLKMLRRLIGEDIDLAWDPKTGLWPVLMDPSQLDQILANLCVNARDAIAGVGKITIETDNVVFDAAYCADHAGFHPGEFVLLAVSDDGCGMDRATMARIFEPFFTTKGVHQGSGLGLATVYGIVKQNDGFINVYSEVGEGTTFRIYLPRHAGVAEAVCIAAENEMPRGDGELLLLVEDEPSIMNMGRNMLEKLGYRVLAASAPAEALRLAIEHPGGIDLLVTDVIMPEMNGRELADRLRALQPGLKCLFMSGYTANVIAHHGVLDPGVNFLQKPVSMRELACKVREALTAG